MARAKTSLPAAEFLAVSFLLELDAFERLGVSQRHSGLRGQRFQETQVLFLEPFRILGVNRFQGAQYLAPELQRRAEDGPRLKPDLLVDSGVKAIVLRSVVHQQRFAVLDDPTDNPLARFEPDLLEIVLAAPFDRVKDQVSCLPLDRQDAAPLRFDHFPDRMGDRPDQFSRIQSAANEAVDLD
jgi:hypothetical protein